MKYRHFDTMITRSKLCPSEICMAQYHHNVCKELRISICLEASNMLTFTILGMFVIAVPITRGQAQFVLP